MPFTRIGAVAVGDPSRVQCLDIVKHSKKETKYKSAPWEVRVRINNEHKTAGIFESQVEARALLAAAAEKLAFVVLVSSAYRASDVVSLRLSPLQPATGSRQLFVKTSFRDETINLYYPDTAQAVFGNNAATFGLVQVTPFFALRASQVVEITPRLVNPYDIEDTNWHVVILYTVTNSLTMAMGFDPVGSFADAAAMATRFVDIVEADGK